MARPKKTSARDRRKARRQVFRGLPRKLQAALNEYARAISIAPLMSDVVCDRCWQAQPYGEPVWDGEDADTIRGCVNCGNETCMTIEAYADVHA